MSLVHLNNPYFTSFSIPNTTSTVDIGRQVNPRVPSHLSAECQTAPKGNQA